MRWVSGRCELERESEAFDPRAVPLTDRPASISSFMTALGRMTTRPIDPSS